MQYHCICSLFQQQDNSLQQDFFLNMEIYYFFEDFPGKICFQSQTLANFFSSMLFLPRSAKVIFFLVGPQHGYQHSQRDFCQDLWQFFARAKLEQKKKTVTQSRILTEMGINGKNSGSYRVYIVLGIDKSFLSGICHWHSCQDLKLIFIQSKPRAWLFALSQL